MKRVMIVDDHAPVIRVLRLGFEAAGYEVEAATNGPECLVRLFNGLPDCLVTDVDMPRMDGQELCLAIEEQFPHRNFPIVVLTSRSENERQTWTRKIPNLRFMEKPVSMRRLISLVRRSLADEA
jgi:CheY-like chemotaxis protein